MDTMAADDGDMTFFDSLTGSPYKGDDDNSVDIYDGLDCVPSGSGNASEQCAPSKDLDLYEELLTEEGVAKETSYKNLHEEFEKCQRQLKDLVQKLKELQTQNSGLQTENLCLKKNISALIKTARVEITRKDDEINRLSQRMTGFRSNYTRNPAPNYVHSSTPEASMLRPNTSRKINYEKPDCRQQVPHSKEVHDVTLQQNPEKDRTLDHEKKSNLLLSKNVHEKQCLDEVTKRARKEKNVGEPSSQESGSDEASKRVRKEKNVGEPNSLESGSDEVSKRARKEKNVGEPNSLESGSDEVSKRARKEKNVGEPNSQESGSDEASKRVRKEKNVGEPNSLEAGSKYRKDEKKCIEKNSNSELKNVDRTPLAPEHTDKAAKRSQKLDTQRIKPNSSSEVEGRTNVRSKESQSSIKEKSPAETNQQEEERLAKVIESNSLETFTKHKKDENRCVGKPTSCERKSYDRTNEVPNYVEKVEKKIQNQEFKSKKPSVSSDCEHQSSIPNLVRPNTTEKNSAAEERPAKAINSNSRDCRSARASETSSREAVTQNRKDESKCVEKHKKDGRRTEEHKPKVPEPTAKAEKNSQESKTINQRSSSDGENQTKVSTLESTMQNKNNSSAQERLHREEKLANACKPKSPDNVSKHKKEESKCAVKNAGVKPRKDDGTCKAPEHINKAEKRSNGQENKSMRSRSSSDVENQTSCHIREEPNTNKDNSVLQKPPEEERLANVTDTNSVDTRLPNEAEPYSQEIPKHKKDNRYVDRHTNSECRNRDRKPKVAENYGKAENKSQTLETRNLKPSSSSEREDLSNVRIRERPKAAKEKSPSEQTLTKRIGESHAIKKKDIAAHEKEVKTTEHKNRSTEKELEEPRRSSRVNNFNSKSDSKTAGHLSKSLLSDSRGEKGAEHRRERRSLDYSSKEEKSTSSSSKENRPTSSKETRSKHDKSEKKSEKRKSEDKNKNQEERREEERHHRGERKEMSDDSLKSRHEIKLPAENESMKSSKSSKTDRKTTATGSPTKPLCKTIQSLQNEESMCRDPKLSFMEKLNLTLSPTKRKSLAEIEELQAALLKARQEGAARVQEWPRKLVVTQYNINDPKEQTECTVQPQGIDETNLVKKVDMLASASQRKSLEESQLDTMQHETAAQFGASLHAKKTVGVKETVHPSNVQNEDCSLYTVMDAELETVSSEELETHSVVDEDNSQLGTPSQNGRRNDPADNDSLDKNISVCEEVVIKSKQPALEVADEVFHLKPNLPESENNLDTTSSASSVDFRNAKNEMNPDSGDESSIVSVDLNHLRNIPQAISPLTSPVRPVVKIHKLESPAMASVVRSLNKDLCFNSLSGATTSKTISNEVNKENQNPVRVSGKCPDAISLLEPSEELEEGEIISSDESEETPIKEKPATKSCKSAEKRMHSKINMPPNQYTSVKNQQNKRKRSNSDEASPKMICIESPTRKTRATTTAKEISTSSSDNDNKKAISPGLDEVEKLAMPSTVREIMQMLRVIRNHIRKKYMKFKVQFSKRQFNGIIETSSANFISFIKGLDWSGVCTSPDCLIQKLCKTIERTLGQVKNNGIVDRIFGQHVHDMKKKLWKFVDDQLDYLFEKMKDVLTKLCDIAKEEIDSDDHSLESPPKHSSTLPDNLPKLSKNYVKPKSLKCEEISLPKSIIRDLQSEVCQRVIPLCQNSKKQELSKTVTDKIKPSMKLMEKSAISTCPSEVDRSQGSSGKFPNAHHKKEGAFKKHKDSQKTGLSRELLTNQQSSSFTFNLVNDAHMGEVFKSLLQDQNTLEESTTSLEKIQLETGTPEKAIAGDEQYDMCTSVTAETVQQDTFLQLDIPDGSSSSVAPSEKSLSSMIQMPVRPDILDESCMLEVPMFSYSSRDNTFCEERDKSYVSVLMEDLAVSLTVPSPLKSDGHLSFLRPQTAATSTPERVINAHYSEDALLDGEDATEQDIHLALESDNSSSQSSCSSSWANQVPPPGFQYCPSEPMHAVIMEKSNDHFIVKIRRALPAASPDTDETSLTDAESLSSATQNKHFSLAQEVSALPHLEGSPHTSTVLGKHAATAPEIIGVPPSIPEATGPLSLGDRTESSPISSDQASMAHRHTGLSRLGVKTPDLDVAKSSELPVLATAPPEPLEPYPSHSFHRPPEPREPYPTHLQPGASAPAKPPASCLSESSYRSPKSLDHYPTNNQFTPTEPVAATAAPSESLGQCPARSSNCFPESSVPATSPSEPHESFPAQSSPNHPVPSETAPGLPSISEVHLVQKFQDPIDLPHKLNPPPEASDLRLTDLYHVSCEPCLTHSKNKKPPESNLPAAVLRPTETPIPSEPSIPPPECTAKVLLSPETSGDSSELESSCSANTTTEGSSELIYVQELEAPEVVVETLNNAAEASACGSIFFKSSMQKASVNSAEVTFVDLTEESDDERSKDDKVKSLPKTVFETITLESGTVSLDNVGSKRKKETASGATRRKKSKGSHDLVIETKRQRKKSRKAEESEYFTKRRSSSKKATPEIVDGQSETLSISPQSLSAKNLIKKKGEVVVAWTRDDDRQILLECQKKGPTKEALNYIAGKLKKDAVQVSERYHLLVKLFKKSAHTSS
ncbi:CASP8-associated protein 2 isoform X2 [Lissotriton helveticus]